MTDPTTPLPDSSTADNTGLPPVELPNRKRFGQFFTPPAIARFLCAWALGGESVAPEGRSHKKGLRLFDPAFGLGAFFDAAREVDPRVLMSGCEIDGALMDAFRSRNPHAKDVELLNADYLTTWDLPPCDSIVCNPPYQRFQNFPGRNDVRASFAQRLGIDISGYANMASAFLLKSLAELPPGGRLAYLMPLEFLNTGYGAQIKTRLLAGGKLKHLVQVDAEKDVFPDAITSVGILLIANDGQEGDPVCFHAVRDMEGLAKVFRATPTRVVLRNKLDPRAKWLHLFGMHLRGLREEALVPLSEYGAFSRGIATGANEFFVLTPSRAAELGLPASVLRRCVTRSSQLISPVFSDETLSTLVAEDAAIYLFDAGEVSGDSIAELAAVRNYIVGGETAGYHERYLTRSRKPWYRVEHRTPAPLWFGVFSREGFKVVRNRSDALHLTTFHGFRPNLFGEAYVDQLFLYFQSKAARVILSQSLRRYGDGLDKFEPNDLNGAFVPSREWFDAVDADMLARAMKAMENGEALPEELEKRFESLLV